MRKILKLASISLLLLCVFGFTKTYPEKDYFTYIPHLDNGRFCFIGKAHAFYRYDRDIDEKIEKLKNSFVDYVYEVSKKDLAPNITLAFLSIGRADRPTREQLQELSGIQWIYDTTYKKRMRMVKKMA